jgi:hypothetical protein
VVHGAWPLAAPGPKNDRVTIGDNPQYRLTVEVPASSVGGGRGSASVWLLLTRHVTLKEVDDDEEDTNAAVATRASSSADPCAWLVFCGWKHDCTFVVDVAPRFPAALPTKDYLAVHVYKNSGMCTAGERFVARALVCASALLGADVAWWCAACTILGTRGCAART